MLSVSTMALAANARLRMRTKRKSGMQCKYLYIQIRQTASRQSVQPMAAGLKLPVKWPWRMPSKWLPGWKCKTSWRIWSGKLQKISTLDPTIRNVTKEE